eukprot:783725_1
MWILKMVLSPLSLYIIAFTATRVLGIIETQSTGVAWHQRGSDFGGDGLGGHVSSNSDGTVVAIGAPMGSDLKGNVGVWEYDGSDNIWGQRGDDIVGEVSADFAGLGIALSKDGDVVAIGAPGHDAVGDCDCEGKVIELTMQYLGQSTVNILFSKSSSKPVCALKDMNPGDEVACGLSKSKKETQVKIVVKKSGEKKALCTMTVDTSCSSVIVGTYGCDNTMMVSGWKGNNNKECSFASSAGQTRIFEYTNEKWTQRGSDINGEAEGDASGFSVALSNNGDVVAIGAPGNNAEAGYAGHVRIYEWLHNELEWAQRGKDIDGDFGDALGTSVSLSYDGNIVAIAGLGHMRVYKYVNDGWEPRGDDIPLNIPRRLIKTQGDSQGLQDLEPQELLALTIQSSSSSLSSDGDIVAFASNGHVYVFAYDEGNHGWARRGYDIPITGQSSKKRRLKAGQTAPMPLSVSLSSDGDTVAVGVPSTKAGYFRVYEYGASGWKQRDDIYDMEAKIYMVNTVQEDGTKDISDMAAGSVSLSSDGNAVVAGAPWAGYVAVYDYVGDDCEYELDPIGKSTQFRITNTCDDSFIKVKMETLTELHANLKKTKNKLTSFASTNWIRSSEDDQTQCDCFGYGGACLYNEFTAYLSDDLDTPDDKEPTFVLKTMFALDVLKVTDTIEVPEGGLKLNVEIGDWPFLQEDDDHYLELCMRIMTNDENTFTLTNNGESYTITSEHISMQNLLSADCGTDKDSVTVNVDPTPNEDGNQLLICYTFDSECDSIVYDPIYSFTHADTESEQSAAANEDTNPIHSFTHADTASEQSDAANEDSNPTNANNDTIDGVNVAVIICVFAFIAAAAAVFCYHQVKRKNEEMISIAAATEPMEEEVIDEDVFGDGNDDETVTVNTKGPTDTIPV